jgi:hypothetical protein
LYFVIQALLYVVLLAFIQDISAKMSPFDEIFLCLLQHLVEVWSGSGTGTASIFLYLV